MKPAFDLNPWQDPGYLEEKDGRLHMDGVELAPLAERFGAPFFIYSERKLRANARAITNAFRSHHDNATVCFASKACSLQGVLRILREEGLSVEVNSGGELMKARLAGFAPGDIVYNGVIKTDEEIRAALDSGIKVLNVDSIYELDRIAAVAGDMGVEAGISLRVVPEVEGGTTPGCETGSSISKFGMLQAEVPRALEIIRGHAGRLRLRGIHVHVGSQVSDISAYRQAVAFLGGLAADLRAEMPTLDLVNMGGGFPVNYVKYNDQSPEIGYFNTALTVEAVAENACAELRRHLGAEIEILTEPGRRMVADTAVMLTRVEGEKHREEDRWLFLDAGYNTVLETFAYKWYFHGVNASRSNAGATANLRLAGPLCDSGDAYHDVDGEARYAKLIEQEPALAAHAERLRASLVGLPPYRQLPADTQVGDLIAFLDCGAYSHEHLFAMNGRPRPSVVLIGEDGQVREMRRRDSGADLLLNEIF